LIEFSDYISKDFVTLAQFIYEHGFKVGVVGGTVRDFQLGLPNKHDYDCELRSLDSSGDLYLNFSALIEDLYEFFEIESLPYGVYRIKAIDFECELTLPRKEVFKNEFHHSNFDVKFIKDSKYSEGFQRRDFTLNAMMMEYDNGWKLIDPLGGRADLATGNLVPCSENFYLDPVRFLRAIRFHIKYHLIIDPRILSRLEEISIENFSAHYIRSEAIKSSKPLTFLLTILELTEDKKKSAHFDLISNFENDNNEESIKKLLTNHLYLETDIFKELTFVLNLSVKEILINKTFHFSDFVSLELEQFNKNFKVDQVLGIYKKLIGMEKVIIEYLFSNEFIDLNYESLQKLSKQSVDLSEFENKDKKYISFLQKVNAHFVL
jgi:tRNA nucleotidyltransferase/poly(A) polymerase